MLNYYIYNFPILLVTLLVQTGFVFEIGHMHPIYKKNTILLNNSTSCQLWFLPPK